MKLLILGGTRFVGRGIVDAALERGHNVTLFNRGQSKPDLYPQLEKLIGDRDGDLSALSGRRWDAIIDTCGYVPRVVGQSVQLLADQVEHYTFISSVSVYADPTEPGVDESHAVGILEDESVEEIDGDTYGPLKALCETLVTQSMPGRSLIVRPGLIVGPYDTSDRFSYWPKRVSNGGEVLAPGRPERDVQFIDVRDLSDWVIELVEKRITGTYNAVSPPGQWSMEEVLEVCKRVSKSKAAMVWVDDDFLVDQGVEAWMEMPLWIPESDPEFSGFFAFDVTKAQKAGLKFREIEETVRDTLAWLKTRNADHQWRAGMKPEREAELLARWRARG